MVHVYKNILVEIKARDKIQPILRGFYKKFHKTWADFEEMEKNALWEQFLVYFRFESPEEEVLGRKAWDDFSSENYPKWLYRWKEAALKEHGSLEIAMVNPPKWAEDEPWTALCTYWMSEEFQKASSIRVVNRAAGTVIPHTSGNTHYLLRTEKKEKELGRPITQYERFLETHSQKVKGTNEKRIVSKEAEEILDNYAKKLKEKHGDSDVPVNLLDDEGLEVYKSVVGGVKKGHLLGRPGEKWSTRKRSNYPPQFESQETSKEVKKLKVELADKDKKISNLTTLVKALCQKVGLDSSSVDLGDASTNLATSDMESDEESQGEENEENREEDENEDNREEDDI